MKSRFTLRSGLAGCALLALGLAYHPASARAEQAYEAWRVTYNNDVPEGHAGNATTTDSRGNVIVAGFAADSNGVKRFYTVKYAATDGSVIWQNIYNSGAEEGVANAVAVDSADNVIVAGRVGNSPDYYTVKYSGASGATLWAQTFAGAQGGADEATLVVVDHADNVIVGGTSVGTNTQEDWYLIKYAGAAGTLQWGRRINGAGNQKDVPVAMAVDGANNLLVTGSLKDNTGKTIIQTRKLDTNGNGVWTITAATGAAGDCEPAGLAVDAAGNVAITAILRAADNSRSGYTAEYTSAGAVLWFATLDCGPDNFTGGPAGVAFDPVGDILITATTQGSDAFETKHITTISYVAPAAAGGGTIKWTANSPSPDQTDYAVKIATDGAGNAIVTGFSDNPTNHDADIYTAKYAADDGHLLTEFRYDGAGSTDSPRALALDDFGNAVVTGVTSLNFNGTNIRYDRIFTAKYNRLRISIGDDAPGAGVADSGIPAGAKIVGVSTPALADTGAMAVKVVIGKGHLRLNAILLQSAGGANAILALQGEPAADAGGGVYATFLDPVIAADGRVAFTGRLRGVPAAKATAIFTTDAAGTVSRRLQAGLQVPDLTAGLLLHSVSSLSWRNSGLVALVRLSGTGVTRQNASVLYGLSPSFGGKILLRTGDPLSMAGATASPIETISAFQPAPGSAGEGRSFSATEILTRVRLANRVTAIVLTNLAGAAPVVVAYTGGPSPVDQATWQTLGLPAIGSADANLAFTGTLNPGAGVTAANRQVIAFGVNTGAFNIVAREGDQDLAGNQYRAFLDPLINNQGALAFVGTLGNPGVNARTRTALWFGAAGAPTTLHLVARLGSAAPEASGVPLAAGAPVFSAFLSTALPGGLNAGPMVLARLAGHGVTRRNNTGVWAQDSNGLLRNLLRTGQTLGNLKVSAIHLLGNTPGALGVTRSFDEAGSVEALVSFTNHTSGVVHLAIP